MYCSKCGKENNDTNIYCNHCGEKLEKNTTKTSNNNISNRFTLENNIIVVVAMFIMFIVFYIMILKLMLPAISYELSILSLIGLAMIVAFTGMLVWEIYYLCQRVKAGDNILIIDKNGITDYLSMSAIGFIPWNDIEDIYISKFGKAEFIDIKIQDETKYLNKVSIIPRIVMLLRKKLGHEIMFISPERVSTKVLFEELNKYRNLSQK